ncbi:hypothetical protein TIFTF001_035855 [Ficus carica]|uniref:Uncharacterized protein n=1 Tax=Ficus carica TaxID=3494 RepID=A0AA88E299_FICCA|nr:hypothetical protein TIFTF001_035855 [Ficus carica]
MPDELVLNMQPDGGSDYVKIEHVPSVLFWYKIQGRNYALYELGKSDLLERLQGVATNFDDVVQHDLRMSFCYSDDEADSASSSTSNVPWNDMLARDRMSFSSDRFSFFSDDIED